MTSLTVHSVHQSSTKICNRCHLFILGGHSGLYGASILYVWRGEWKFFTGEVSYFFNRNSCRHVSHILKSIQRPIGNECYCYTFINNGVTVTFISDLSLIAEFFNKVGHILKRHMITEFFYEVSYMWYTLLKASRWQQNFVVAQILEAADFI